MLIDIQDLTFAYAKKQSLLRIDQWSVAEKQHTFLHGPSGTGKSTLLNILSGVLSGYSGQVQVLNQRLDLLSQRQLDRFRAENIGYVFQQFNLIPFLTPLENLSLATQFAKPQQSKIQSNAHELLSQLGLIESEWHNPVSQLSIGQQQRVAIARALINTPKLLIADEPTSSLDQANRDRFMQLLMTLASQHDTSLLFVSHDLTLSSYFENTISLDQINSCSKSANNSDNKPPTTSPASSLNGQEA